MMWAYSIACGKLLLCADDGTASLSLVKSSFATNHCLTLGGSTTGLAADLGYGVPVVHDVCIFALFLIVGIDFWWYKVSLISQQVEWRVLKVDFPPEVGLDSEVENGDVSGAIRVN